MKKLSANFSHKILSLIIVAVMICGGLPISAVAHDSSVHDGAITALSSETREEASSGGASSSADEMESGEDEEGNEDSDSLSGDGGGETSTGGENDSDDDEEQAGEADSGSEETPDDETPEDETPDGETPDDETPEDETPDGETPDDETPDDETPDDETPDDETPNDETPDNETPADETDSGDDVIEDETGAADNIPSSYRVTGFATLADDVDNQAVPYGTFLEDLILPDELVATISNGEGETETAVAVEIWRSDPEYDPETLGTYAFTPELPEEYSFADGVDVPVITVEVQPLIPEAMAFLTDIDSLRLAALAGGSHSLNSDITINTVITEGSNTAGLIIGGDMVLDLNGHTLTIDFRDHQRQCRAC